MVQIEFLDPGPAQDAAPEPAPAPGRAAGAARKALLLAPPGLWLAAAVFLVVAPFRLLYLVTLSASGLGRDTRVDGWGRLHQADDPFPDHETRYGVVLCVAAGLCVVAAAVATLVRRHPRARIVSAAMGLTGVVLATGTVASALLYLQSLDDNITVQLRTAAASGDLALGPALSSVHLSIGGMTWLTLTAVGCGLAALGIQALPVPAVPEPPSPAPPSPPHPQDEVLPAPVWQG
jgi:hypothetical protein